MHHTESCLTAGRKAWLTGACPWQVDAIASTADRVSAPYVHSAKKQACRLSVAASDFMRRSSFGIKAHRR